MDDNKEIRIPKEINRKSLYEYFESGMRPSANDFKDLIFSTINKLDDGISKSFKYGLKLSPEGEKEGEMENVISLYERIDTTEPLWTFSLNGETENKKLCISSGKSDKVLLTLTHDGKVGINNVNPENTLDVLGAVAMSSRVGTHRKTIKANGEWQTILKGLKGCNMFEVVAMAYGQKGSGKYATLYAIASNAYNGKRGRIHCTRNKYGWMWWRRLGLRWVGDPYNYELQIRTFSNYGNGGEIECSIMQLGQQFINEEDNLKEEQHVSIEYPEK